MAYSPTIQDAKELIKLSADVYGDRGPVPAGWLVIGTHFDALSGLKVMAYQ